MRDARHHRLLITDKTPANVLAYARLVLDQDDPQIRAVLRSMESLCRTWMPLACDAVIHWRDHFDQRAGGDRVRERVLDLQDAAGTAVYEAVQQTGVPVLDLPPPGLTKAYLHQRWQEGCTTAKTLFDEIKTAGYTGGLTVLRDYLRPLRSGAQPQDRSTRPPSVRDVTSWITRHPDSLSTDETLRLKGILARCPSSTPPPTTSGPSPR